MQDVKDYIAPKGKLPVGTPVRINSVDPFGFIGRNPHPPTDGSVIGTTAYVCRYHGWLTMGVHSWSQQFGDTFHTGPTGPYEHWEEVPVHFYYLLVPNVGIYEYCDYEFELVS